MRASLGKRGSGAGSNAEGKRVGGGSSADSVSARAKPASVRAAPGKPAVRATFAIGAVAPAADADPDLDQRKGRCAARPTAVAAPAAAPAPRVSRAAVEHEPEAPYTLRAIAQMLGLGRGAITRMVQAGFVSPVRGVRNEYRFSFQDMVLLRTAWHLKAADVAPHRLMQALRRLKARLPAEVPLSGLRIQAVGNDVVVREGAAQVNARSGQLLMDFGVAPAPQGAVAFLPQATAPTSASASRPALQDAIVWFSRAEQLEEADPDGAEHAYRQAITLAPQDANAYLNLGAMLCETGRCQEAVALFEQGMTQCPQEALLAFNRAVALEDQQHDAEALASYEHALALAPDLADAHFNAARLYRAQGQTQRALRHYSAYKRLTSV